MKRKFYLLVLLLCSTISLVLAWGVWGHEHINRAAVFALPEPMGVFFYNHLDFVTEEAGVPDLRKYTINDKAEFARHYIDLEYFGEHAVDSLPRTMKEIKMAYPDSILQKYGILPWYIQEITTKLTLAFKEKRKGEILFLAADLGHYLGDAHMPLHTALNHDGQFTNQKGIHALWESQLPELFGEHYNFYTGPARYIPDITAETWRIISASHQLEDPLLLTEQKLKSIFPEDKIYKKDAAGNILKNKFNQPIHSEEYARKYHEMLNGMVEKQLRAAISAVADFWYTAWVNAGKPELRDLDAKSLTTRNAPFYQMDKEAWKKGKLTNLQSDPEF